MRLRLDVVVDNRNGNFVRILQYKFEYPATWDDDGYIGEIDRTIKNVLISSTQLQKLKKLKTDKVKKT